MTKKTILVCSMLLFAVCIKAGERSRIVTNFDSGWSFFLGDAEGADKQVFNDKEWRKLNLPLFFYFLF